MKRYLSLLLGLLMTLSLFSGCAKELAAPALGEYVDFTTGFALASSAENELVKVSENANFVLYANFSNGEAAVEDKRTGTTWYTNPADKSEDGLAAGFNKNALQSVITMVYTTSVSVDMTCGGFMSSVRKDGLYYRVDPDGSVIFYFDFPNEMISIPIRYRIEEDCFTAEVIAHGIAEYGTNVIKSIDLLPFFGAGGSKEEGYLLVPDGSGALIHFNNDRLTAKSYSKPLYGFDNGTSDKIMGGAASSAYFTLSENQQLPVFGVSKGDQGFLAIVTEGAARAGINANVAYKYTLYNTVWPTYNFHTIGTVRQTQKDGSENITSAPEKKTEVWENFKVSYHFLDAGSNTYADMAALYRNWLMENKGLTPLAEGGDLPLYLDLYGYIEKTKSFMGIPAELRISIAPVEDVNALLDTLQIPGIVVNYNYWSSGSYFDRIPTKLTPDSKVGSRKELLELQARLESQGGGLFLSADLLNVYKTGRGISQYGSVLRNAANTNQRQYAFSLSSAMVDSRYDAWYLLRPSLIGQTLTDYAGKFTAKGYTGLSLESAGAMLYSELSSTGIGRNQMRSIMESTFSTVAQTTGALMLTTPNDYAAVYADHLLQTPTKASNYDIEDESVPFYQMVFHGCADYSLSPVNLSSNPADTTLKHLEYGAAPMWSLITRNTDELIGSRMDRLYSADAAVWTDFIPVQYKQLNEALGGLRTEYIVGHEILSKDLRTVTYSDGTVIHINYGTAPATVNGIRLPAKGYAVIAPGAQAIVATAAGK